MKKDIYIFSGLGADEQVFDKLDVNAYNVFFMNWMDIRPGENISDYAKRYSAKITSATPVIMGLSFGGIIAIEIAKYLPNARLILIATAKTKFELPFYYRISRITRLHKILPLKSGIIRFAPVRNWLFGVHTPKDKSLLKKYIREVNPVFLRWAINAIVTWNNTQLPLHYIHIHGTNDKIFPIGFIKPGIIKINNGEHLLPLYNYNEINKILKEYI